MESEIYVSKLMISEVVTSTPDERLSNVIAKMSNLALHEIPVVDEKKRLLGYFSFDILLRRKHVPLYTKIEKLMVAPPKIEESESVFEAAKIMLETGFRAIPVVDSKDCLKGIISRTDIIKVVPKLRGVSRESAEEIMTPEPEVLKENDEIEKALALMVELDEPSAPVVDRDGKIVGSVLLSDISRSMWYEREGENSGDLVGEKDKPKIEVKAFVSPAAVVKRDEKVMEVCERMGRINPYMCIVTDDFQKPIGVITQYDILKRLVKYTPEKGVYVDITGLDLDIGDPFVYSSMSSKIERFVKKVSKFNWIKPYTLNLHIGKHHKGGRVKWSIRAKFRTDKGLFYVKTHDWDVLKCVDEIIEELNRKIMDIK